MAAVLARSFAANRCADDKLARGFARQELIAHRWTQIDADLISRDTICVNLRYLWAYFLHASPRVRVYHKRAVYTVTLDNAPLFSPVRSFLLTANRGYLDVLLPSWCGLDLMVRSKLSAHEQPEPVNGPTAMLRNTEGKDARPGPRKNAPSSSVGCSTER